MLPMLGATDGPVLVQVGRPSNSRRFSLGRLTLSLAPIAQGGYARAPRGRVPRGRAIAITAGGPAANLLVSLLCWRLAEQASGAPQEALIGTAIVGVLMALINLAPHWEYSVAQGATVPNDGLRLQSLLTGRKPVRPPAGKRYNRALTVQEATALLFLGVIGGSLILLQLSLSPTFLIGAMLHSIPTMRQHSTRLGHELRRDSSEGRRPIRPTGIKPSVTELEALHIRAEDPRSR